MSTMSWPFHSYDMKPSLLLFHYDVGVSLWKENPIYKKSIEKKISMCINNRLENALLNLY